MHIVVEIDRTAAIKASNPKFGFVELKVDLEQLSPEQREELTYCPVYGKKEGAFINTNAFFMPTNREDYTMPDDVYAQMPIIGPIPDQKAIATLLDIRKGMRDEMGKKLADGKKLMEKYKADAIEAFLKNEDPPDKPEAHEGYCSGSCYCRFLQSQEWRNSPQESEDVDKYYHGRPRGYYRNDPAEGHSQHNITPYLIGHARYVISDKYKDLKVSYDEVDLDISLDISLKDPRVKKRILELEREAVKLTNESKTRAEEELQKRVAEKDLMKAEEGEWIAQHGSDHLKRVFREGYPYQGQYIEERARTLLYGSGVVVVDSHGNAKYGDRVAPSERALDYCEWLKENGHNARAVWAQNIGSSIINQEAIMVKAFLGKHNVFIAHFDIPSKEDRDHEAREVQILRNARDRRLKKGTSE
jgi:hypothetical protein